MQCCQTCANNHMQCTNRAALSLQRFFFFVVRWEWSSSFIIHRPRFHKVYMPGVNERTCGFACVSTLAPVFAVSESLIAVTLRDRQACAKTMASKSWRLTATDSHLPPKHTSGPLRSPPTTPSFCFFSLCQGRLRRLRDKEKDVINWHLSLCFVLVRTQRTFVKVLKDILKDFVLSQLQFEYLADEFTPRSGLCCWP